MRIIHLSHVHIPDYDDPNQWLERLSFYTIQLEEMTKYADVKSIHLINYEGVVTKNQVEYHFLKISKNEVLFPVAIHSYVETLKPDLVFVHGLCFPWQIICLHTKLKGKIKIAAAHHAEKPLRFHRGFLQRIADRYIDAYFFTSKELAMPWVEAGQINNLEKVHEVMEVSTAFHVSDKPDTSRNNNRYVWVGRFDKNKDSSTLIKAFLLFLKSRQDVFLDLVYRGTVSDEIKVLLKDNQPTSHQIILYEDFPHPELLNLFNNAGFVVSTSYYESGGAAVCEGMACGCIPILTNIPSFRIMTNNGSVGLLFQPGNEIDLLNALIHTSTMNVVTERQQVLEQFKENLSGDAIARKIVNVANTLFKT